MNATVFTKLSEQLLKNEYYYLKIGADDEKTMQESTFASFSKEAGNLLHVALLIQADKCSFEQYLKLQSYFKQLIEEHAFFKNRGAILFATVLIGEYFLDNTTNVHATLKQESYAPGEFCYQFYYNALPVKKLVQTPDKQPDTLRLSQLIAACFDGGVNHESQTLTKTKTMTMAQLQETVKNNTNLKQKYQKSTLTFLIMAINVFVFVIMTFSGGTNNYLVLVEYGAVQQQLVFEHHEYYRLFTAMFIHIGFAHLAHNLLALYIYGSRVEQYLGRFEMIMIYLCSGLSASLLASLLSSSLMAGASGAIFGLLGAICTMLIFIKKSIGDFSPYFVLMLAITGLTMGFIYPGISNTAHITGFITGFIVTIPFATSLRRQNNDDKEIIEND